MKVIWYEKGTNAVRQIVYESQSAAQDVSIAQLNNVLLIRDGNRIAKCIFDTSANNGQGEYKIAIVDIPMIPKMHISLEETLVQEVDHVVFSLYPTKYDYFDDNDEGGYTVAKKPYNKNKMSLSFHDWDFKRKNMIYDNSDLEVAKARFAGAYKALATAKPKYYMGYVFISYAYELFDGSVTKPTPPRMLQLGDDYDRDAFYFLSVSNEMHDDERYLGFRAIFNTTLTGTVNYGVLNGNQINSVHAHKIHITMSNMPNYEAYKDLIKGVVVYCSKPIDIYDWENLRVEYLHCTLAWPYSNGLSPSYDAYSWVNGDDIVGTVPEGRMNLSFNTSNIEGLERYKLNAENLNNMILYEVEKIALGSTELSRELDLTSIESRPNITADASGWWATAGEMFVYNQRLHLFNYTQELIRDSFNFWWRDRNLIDNYILARDVLAKKVYVRIVVWIKTDNGDINVGDYSQYMYVGGEGYKKLYIPRYMAYPDSRAYKMDFYVHFTDTYGSDIRRKGTLKLYSSKVMNVAFAGYEAISNLTVSGFVETDINIIDLIESEEEPPNDNLFYSNYNNIIVSELSNPFYFPVRHSYQAGAAIVQLAVAHEEITSSQVGQFPLYVFTEERIFALEAGAGDVLYGRVVPVSAEVCINKNVLQTKFGILFVAASGLKVISGRTIVDISDVIEKNYLDLNVRKQQGATPSPYEQVLSNSALVMLYGNLSAVVFDEYVKGAAFGYDINNNEIIVSNSRYDYSYVYEINNRQWHKITDVFDMFSMGLALSKANGEGKRDVVDIREETGDFADVLIQTRPIKLNSYAFKVIRRMAVRGEINTAKGAIFGFYSFGSDNLRNYKMVSAKQYQGYFGVLIAERLRQWKRYIVIVCAGRISRDSSISHFEIEGEEKINTRDR